MGWDGKVVLRLLSLELLDLHLQLNNSLLLDLRFLWLLHSKFGQSFILTTQISHCLKLIINLILVSGNLILMVSKLLGVSIDLSKEWGLTGLHIR